jgi:hypothetical protein
MPDTIEEQTKAAHANVRNFYKVEKWTRDGMKVDSLLYAGNSLPARHSSVRSSIDRASG